MNPLLAEWNQTGTVRNSEGQPLRLTAYIPAYEGELLQSIIQRLNARRCLEIGLAHGYSALWICDALSQVPGASHIIIDPYQQEAWQGLGLQLLERAGFNSLIQFYAEPSHRILPRLVQQQLELDFAFVDGNHNLDFVFVDFFYLDMLMRVGGVIVFDDANYPLLRLLIRFILTNRAYRVYATTPGAPHVQYLTLRRTAHRFVERFPKFKRVLHPDLTLPEISFQIPTGSRCVALEKIANDPPRRETIPF